VALNAAPHPVHVRGSAGALNDALRNLIENALTHSPEGSTATVTVTLDRSIHVSDRGPGVPDALKSKIFQRFWRAPDADTPGAGLGLAIVAQTAAAHGGRVEVLDADGGGAEFILHLG
jgi:signal transduction histidine kinase